MKTKNIFLTLFVQVFLLVSLSGQAVLSTKEIQTSVTGTSTLHDWEMKSQTGSCTITADFDAQGNLTSIKDMKFSFPVKTLKSGKGAMDKNAYKALKSDQFANIHADLKSAKVTTKDQSTYHVTASILLNIGGQARQTDMNVIFKKVNAKQYQVSSTKKINMKDFGVEPPSFMMGTVTTGQDVNVNFQFNLYK